MILNRPNTIFSKPILWFLLMLIIAVVSEWSGVYFLFFSKTSYTYFLISMGLLIIGIVAEIVILIRVIGALQSNDTNQIALYVVIGLAATFSLLLALKIYFGY